MMRKYFHITTVLENGLSITSTNIPAENKEQAFLDYIKRNKREIENIISITIIEREDTEV